MASVTGVPARHAMELLTPPVAPDFPAARLVPIGEMAAKVRRDLLAPMADGARLSLPAATRTGEVVGTAKTFRAHPVMAAMAMPMMTMMLAEIAMPEFLARATTGWSGNAWAAVSILGNGGWRQRRRPGDRGDQRRSNERPTHALCSPLLACDVYRATQSPRPPTSDCPCTGRARLGKAWFADLPKRRAASRSDRKLQPSAIWTARPMLR